MLLPRSSTSRAASPMASRFAKTRCIPCTSGLGCVGRPVRGEQLGDPIQDLHLVLVGPLLVLVSRIRMRVADRVGLLEGASRLAVVDVAAERGLAGRLAADRGLHLVEAALEKSVALHRPLPRRRLAEQPQVVATDPADVLPHLVVGGEELGDLDQRVGVRTARPVQFAALLPEDLVPRVPAELVAVQVDPKLPHRRGPRVLVQPAVAALDHRRDLLLGEVLLPVGKAELRARRAPEVGPGQADLGQAALGDQPLVEARARRRVEGEELRARGPQRDEVVEVLLDVLLVVEVPAADPGADRGDAVGVQLVEDLLHVAALSLGQRGVERLHPDPDASHAVQHQILHHVVAGQILDGSEAEVADLARARTPRPRGSAGRAS